MRRKEKNLKKQTTYSDTTTHYLFLWLKRKKKKNLLRLVCNRQRTMPNASILCLLMQRTDTKLRNSIFQQIHKKLFLISHLVKNFTNDLLRRETSNRWMSLLLLLLSTNKLLTKTLVIISKLRFVE